MSIVCYCGQPDCPVTTWEHDACVANLRAERDALRAQVANLEAELAQGVEACRAHVCLGAQEAKAERDELAAALRGREVGNRGDSESAVDVAERLIRERDEAVAALRRLMSVVDGGESGVAQVVDVSHSARAVLAKYPEGK